MIYDNINIIMMMMMNLLRYNTIRRVALLLFVLLVCNTGSILLVQCSARLTTLPNDLLESSMDYYYYYKTTTTNNNNNNNGRDPALQIMKYNIGDGEKETYVYVEPSLEQMYHPATTTTKLAPPSVMKVIPKFNGFAGKFINMSNKTISLYWEEYANGPRHLMKTHEPFTASGTGTFPGHRFVFCEMSNPKITLQTFVVKQFPYSIYYYDPYHIDTNPQQTTMNLQALSSEERTKYDILRRTLLFNEYYLQHTGRSYLANYLRPPPIHFMWPGEYFGQEHWVLTKEVQFIQQPSDKELQPITTYGTERQLQSTQRRLLQQYRDPTKKVMNMTLINLSVAPRVFLIPNFLSQTEVNHILQLAAGIDLQLSKTGEGASSRPETTNVRTSYNSWVHREMSPIIDAIYRRAADLLRIDESLLRHRHETKEFVDSITARGPICEALQLVHYVDQQEYKAHHDFQYNKMDHPPVDGQSARFATLLLYLNDEGMVGGETSFPRWVNGETFKQLKVKPVAGNAILFYNQLPDGNMDDLSEHAALPVYDGEKWLINLWVWDPVYE